MNRTTLRVAGLLVVLLASASCGTAETRRDGGSAHTIRELCRYPLDFFTERLHRAGLEVTDRINEQDDEIGEIGTCLIGEPSGGLSSLTVYATLKHGERVPMTMSAGYEERDAIRVGADTVRTWSRDDGMGRDLRVEVDGWIGHLTVVLNEIGEPTGDTALPDEHLSAAAEMLVRMTRDLKGRS